MTSTSRRPRHAGDAATKVQGRVGRVLPDSVTAEMHGSMAEPGSAKD